MEFSRLEYWSGWPCISPGDLPNPGIEPRSPELQVDSLPAEPKGKPQEGIWVLMISSQNAPWASYANLLTVWAPATFCFHMSALSHMYITYGLSLSFLSLSVTFSTPRSCFFPSYRSLLKKSVCLACLIVLHLHPLPSQDSGAS